MRRRSADTQGLRDAATLLPVAATILLLPPFILVFAVPALVGGVPLIVLYLFGVWAAVIFAAWLVARRQARMPDERAPAEETSLPAADPR